MIRFKDFLNHFLVFESNSLVLWHVTHLCILKTRFSWNPRVHKTRLIVNLIQSFQRSLGVKIRADKLRWRESHRVGETRATSALSFVPRAAVVPTSWVASWTDIGSWKQTNPSFSISRRRMRDLRRLANS